jgi:hypothetical protein
MEYAGDPGHGPVFPFTPTPDPTPSPTPKGTCEYHKGEHPKRFGMIYQSNCVNWTPEPSPGTEEPIELDEYERGILDRALDRIEAAEGLEPPPLTSEDETLASIRAWWSPAADKCDDESAALSNAGWLLRRVDALTARLAESEQRAKRYREVVEKAKEVYKHMTVDSAGVAPDEAKLIAALDRLEDNQ